MLLTQKNSLEHLRKKGVPHIVGSLASSFSSNAVVQVEHPLARNETQKGLSYSPRAQKAGRQIAELRLAAEICIATAPSESAPGHTCNTGYNAATIDLIGRSKSQSVTSLLEPEHRTLFRFNEPETQWRRVPIEESGTTLHANVSAEKTSAISKNRTDEERASLDWVEENCSYLEKFAGEWILVVGKDLVAHSTRHRDILQIVKERRPVGALIHYVPRGEEAVFVL